MAVGKSSDVRHVRKPGDQLDFRWGKCNAIQHKDKII